MNVLLPLAVERYLTPQRLSRTVAHVLVDSGGEIASSGGALSHFGLDPENPSWLVDMFTPWFDPAAVPEDRAPIPFVALEADTYADVHFVADGERTWIVLVDCTSEAVVAQGAQQRRLEPLIVDLRSRIPTTHASVLCGLTIGAFERAGSDAFRAAGQLPDWIEAADETLGADGRIRPTTHPVLQYFLPEAEEAWADESGPPVESLVWSEALTTGEVVHLQALAMPLPESDVLLLRKLFDREIENSANVQRANDQALLAADAERRLYNESQRLRVTLESIAEAVVTTDRHGRIEFMNPGAEALTGWKLASASGRPISEVVELIHEPTHDAIENPVAEVLATREVARSEREATLLGRNGVRYGVEESAAPIFDADNELLGVVVVLKDVTAMRAMVREVRHQAEHDVLTGLANRREFGQLVQRAIARSRATGERHAICYLDLDHFKAVNDSDGHQAGDAVLQQVADRLMATVRSGDIVARVGGDEFCVLLERCDIEAAERVAADLVEAIDRDPFVWGTSEYALGVSIGVSEVTHESESLGDAMARADEACYVAKRQSGSAVFCYDQVLELTRPSTSQASSNLEPGER